MELMRINELLQQGAISAQEHEELVRMAMPPLPIVRRTSGCAVACLLLGALAWVLMLTYTINGRPYSLLPSGEARLAAGGILSLLALGMFFAARSQIRQSRGEVGGMPLAAAGLALAIAIGSIVVPVLLILLSMR